MLKLDQSSRLLPPVSWPPPGHGVFMVAHKKKGRLRCHRLPKSGEETPKEGSDSGRSTAYLIDKTIAIGGSIERR